MNVYLKPNILLHHVLSESSQKSGAIPLVISVYLCRLSAVELNQIAENRGFSEIIQVSLPEVGVYKDY